MVHVDPVGSIANLVLKRASNQNVLLRNPVTRYKVARFAYAKLCAYTCQRYLTTSVFAQHVQRRANLPPALQLAPRQLLRVGAVGAEHMCVRAQRNMFQSGDRAVPAPVLTESKLGPIRLQKFWNIKYFVTL